MKAKLGMSCMTFITAVLYVNRSTICLHTIVSTITNYQKMITLVFVTFYHAYAHAYNIQQYKCMTIYHMDLNV